MQEVPHVHMHVMGGPRPWAKGVSRAGRERIARAPLESNIGRLTVWRCVRSIIMGSFSVWHWLIVLLIVVLVFGTKKLKNIGSDLGGAVKGFKDGIKEGGASQADPSAPAQQVTANKNADAQHRRRRGQDQVVSVRRRVRPSPVPA